MTRRWAAWLLSVPLAVVGAEVVHWLVYRIMYPDPVVRAGVLAASGHSYFQFAPVGGALLAALVVLGFVGRALASRVGGGRNLDARTLMVLSPLLFVFQECGETLATGHSPFAAVYAPTFLPGLLLQLPFALAAYGLARLLLGGADRLNLLVGRVALSAVPALLVPLRRPTVWAGVSVTWLFRGGVGTRGPPPAASRS